MSRVLRPLLLIAALLAVPAVQAQSTQSQGGKQQAQTQQTQQAQTQNSRPSSLPASVRRVERETGGEVISAEPVRRDGREVYNLKVLTPNGRVKVVQEDPNPRRERAEREPSRQDRGSQDRDRQDRDRQDRDTRPQRESEQPRRRDDDDGGNDSQL